FHWTGVRTCALPLAAQCASIPRSLVLFTLMPDENVSRMRFAASNIATPAAEISAAAVVKSDAQSGAAITLTVASGNSKTPADGADRQSVVQGNAGDG